MTGAAVVVIDALKEEVEWLAFSPDGRFVTASGPTRAADIWGTINFWPVAGGAAPVRSCPADGYVNHYVLGPTGRWAYGRYSTANVCAIDLAAGKTYKLGDDGSHTVPAVSPDGRRVIARVWAAGDPNPVLKCWRQPPGSRPRAEWAEPSRRRDPFIAARLAFLPGGDRFAVFEFITTRTRRHCRVAIRDAATGAYLQAADTAFGAEAFVAAPDGTRVVGRWGDRLLVWAADDLAAGPRAVTAGVKAVSDQRFSGPTIAYHPSGRYLAVTNRDRTVTLLDAEAWRVAKTYRWPVDELRAVAFSPDGTLAAAGSDTGAIVVWDVDV